MYNVGIVLNACQRRSERSLAQEGRAAKAVQKFLRRLNFSEARREGAGLRDRVLSVTLKGMLPHARLP